MSIQLIKNPVITEGGNVFKWNAVGNPLIYEFDTVSTGDNYRVEIFVRDPSDDSLLIEEPAVYTPDASGFLRVDLSGLVASLLVSDIPDTLNQDLRSEVYYIDATEVSDAGTGATASDRSNPVGIVLANQQLRENSNLRDFTPIINQTGVGFEVNNRALFLTRFREPSLWVGWPTTVSGISNENAVAGAGRVVMQEALDINRQDLNVQEAISLSDVEQDQVIAVPLDQNRLTGQEQFRRIEARTAISLFAVIDAVNTLAGGGINSMLDAGDWLRDNQGGPDRPYSLLQLASQLL